MNKLRTLSFVVGFLVGTSSFANERLGDSQGKNPQGAVRAPSSVQVETCESMTHDFKTLESQEYFLSQCFDHYLGSAKPGAVKHSEDGRTLVFGYESMLFSKIADKRFVIAGLASRLSSVRSLALDARKNEVWVLDADRIFVFPLGVSGNRAPLRGLEGRWIRGVSALAVDSENDEVYALNPSLQRVLVYDRNADMLYRSRTKKLAPKREVYAKNREILDATSLFACSQRKDFGVLVPSHGKIYFFASQAKGWTQPTAFLGVASNAVAASCSGERIQVLDSDGLISDIRP